MSGLTKILVVLAAVLSVFLSAMVVAYAVNTDRIQSDYARARSEKLAAEANYQSQSSQWQGEQARMTNEASMLKAALETVKNDLSHAEQERANLLTEKQKAESTRDSIAAKIKELTDTVTTMQNLIASYREEVTTLRKSELTYRQQRLEMEDRVSDLESQRDVLQQNFRALNEQLAEAKTALVKAQTGVGTTAATNDQPWVYPGPPIRGTIENVQADKSTGKTLAKINVGTNNQVGKNMKFYVVRGNDFIANLVVVQTDLKWSIGEIDTLGRAVEVKDGDQVVSRLQ